MIVDEAVRPDAELPAQGPYAEPGAGVMSAHDLDGPDWKGPLGEAFNQAVTYLESLRDRPVRSTASLAELRAALGGPLPEKSTDPGEVIATLAKAAEPGIMPSSSGRYFGFVVGGATPAAVAADWLTSAWDQNAGLYVLGPAASVVEQVAGAWLAELFGLPEHVSVGFVTGGQMANVTGLAAARDDMLRRVGWDVESAGLCGAPRLRVIAGQGRHGTIDRALRLLGLGTASIVEVDMDAQGRMRLPALQRALEQDSAPAIVCTQVGNVNTGAIDPVGEICEVAHQHGSWVHVDGAFGLWAAASQRLRPLLAGVEQADSWATDAHKWLNVPYDSGLVFCAHPDAHRAAMAGHGSYLVRGSEEERDALDYSPEHSRRARGFAVYAAIRALGRTGIADMVERCCSMARRFADQLAAAADGVEVINDVVLNQVLIRLHAPDGDDDAHTHRVLERVQSEGTCWMSGTKWNGRAAVRISVSNWSTNADDVDRSVAAVLQAHRAG